MKIKLILSGPLRVPAGGREVEGEFSAGITVKQVVSRLLECPPEQIRFLLVTLAGEHINFDQKLKEDCTLQVFMRLGGG